MAKNDVGETHVIGLLSWEKKNHLKRLDHVKCYPVNHSTLLVEYESENTWNDFLYYTSSKTDTGAQQWMTNHLQSDNKIKNQIIINNLKCPPYKMFWFYMRVLEKTGSETTGISENTLYEMSRLSKGIKCAIQGR